MGGFLGHDGLTGPGRACRRQGPALRVAFLVPRLSNIVRNMTDEMIAALAQEAAGPIEVPNLTRGAVREGLHARRHYLRAVQGARQSQ